MKEKSQEAREKKKQDENKRNVEGEKRLLDKGVMVWHLNNVDV